MAKHKISAEKWNEKHRPGIGVLVKLDDGKLWHTKTRSEAWELGHGQPVVMLEGKARRLRFAAHHSDGAARHAARLTVISRNR